MGTETVIGSIDWFALIDQGPLVVAWYIFINGGWLVFLLFFIYGLYLVWLNGRRQKFSKKWQHVLLAIDIPRNNEQTPKAVESIFIALAGAQTNPNYKDKYWIGKVQESFSFEIVSLEGYIQFLVRTPAHFRDLIEAAVYAQYPDAEITEVEDYARPFSGLRFPSEKYNLWGSDFILTKDYPYPIRTYPEFEFPLTGVFLDPMAGMLESLSRFGPGEQLWLQFVITPPSGWDDKAKKVVKDIVGEKYAKSPRFIDYITSPIEGIMGWVQQFIIQLTSSGTVAPGSPVKKDEGMPNMMRLTPGDRTLLEKIQQKLSKHPFRVKIRMVYLAEHTIFNRGRGIAGVISAIQQYNTSNANGLKPGKRSRTAADYFNIQKRVAERQNKILRHYVNRDNSSGDSMKNMMLNCEELASLWHFPVITVKAAQVEKVQSKKIAPPTRLPYELRRTAAEISSQRRAQISVAEDIAQIDASDDNGSSVRPVAAPPPNLPTI
jgi:hypothetical protein